MSVFLTPDLRPIVGGTYFPPEDTFRQTGFKTILINIAQKVEIFLFFNNTLEKYKYFFHFFHLITLTFHIFSSDITILG